MSALKEYLSLIGKGASLNEDEASRAMEAMLSGAAEPAEIAEYLTALALRGETIEEITGSVKAMRAHMVKVEAPQNAIDTCGTGGDGADTFNISTACAFVLAGAGVPVAKHGNRAATSRSGSSQVLEALGVNVNLGPEDVTRCIREAGIGFMFAPLHHAAMKYVAPVRQALGRRRTIFNLLGPLSNPALVTRQVIGVFDKNWVEPFAHVLQKLGAKTAWVVHGSDGLDELTTTGKSHVAALSEGKVTVFDVTPEDAGLKRALSENLKGGDAAHNAAALLRLLKGEEGAYRDIVLLNAAAGLIVAGKASDLEQGANLAAESLKSGSALHALGRLIAASNAPSETALRS